MPIVVQKYGGTSVSTVESREAIARNVIKAKEAGNSVLVVVSAMGRNGAPYATDTLIGLFNDVSKEENLRDLDLLMSCGETISATIMSQTIRNYGYKTMALTGFQAGIQTDERFGDANVKHVDTKRLLHLLDEDYILVVTGFQGITKAGDVTTLGRGGSDNTAALLGAALNADAVEIYTDVDGVMTADPRVVEHAKLINQISYEEIYQMAIDGAKVVDHKAVDVAKRSGVVLKVKNTFSDSQGTTIMSDSLLPPLKKDWSNVVTAVAAKKDVLQVTVFVDNHSALNEALLDGLEKEQISIDLINFLAEKKVFTIFEKDERRLKKLLDNLKLEYSILESCAKVTVIGYRIHGVPGVMKRIVLSLAKANVNILQSSDSSNTISVLVSQSDVDKTMKTLHSAFNLD